MVDHKQDSPAESTWNILCFLLSFCFLPGELRLSPSLSLSVHLHVLWAAPACRRGAVLRDCAALGEPHGFRPSISLCRPQAQAAGGAAWTSVGLAGVWAGASTGSEGLHKHMGCPHTWRSGGSWSNCQQTWVHQLRTCKLKAFSAWICIKPTTFWLCKYRTLQPPERLQNRRCACCYFTQCALAVCLLSELLISELLYSIYICMCSFIIIIR